MIREIWFRGKRIDTGEWVQGFYVLSKYGSPSITFAKGDLACYPIDPGTFGQYTCVQDIKGVKIFEGDIVFIRWCLDNVMKKAITGVIEYSEGLHSFTVFF